VTEVARGRFTVLNDRGMHARAASQLVKLASTYPCEIVLAGPDEEAVSAKSVMGVLLLCGVKGTVIEVEARGERAEEALQAIGDLFAKGFGEEA
jgi:phosphocarrier protein